VLRMRNSADYHEWIQSEYLDEDWDAAAGRFLRSAALSDVLEYLRMLGITGGARVLDLGGGRGLLSHGLYKNGYHPTLLEISMSAVTGLGSLAGSWEGFEPVCANAEEMPFRDGVFDVVVCKQVIHHSENLPRLLSEVFRILRHGGAVIAYKEHCLPWYGGKHRFLKEHPSARMGAQENAFRTITYHRAFRSCGFKKMTIVDIEPPERMRQYYLQLPIRKTLLQVPLIGALFFWVAYLSIMCGGIGAWSPVRP